MRPWWQVSQEGGPSEPPEWWGTCKHTRFLGITTEQDLWHRVNLLDYVLVKSLDSRLYS